MADFFGIPANTSTLIYKLGKKNKVPIVYIFSERLKNSKGFDIHLGLINNSFYDLEEEQAALFLNKTIEDLINKNITQYLWSYERFRNRSGVEENIYN
jgi:KDO2-lipid IV(A) lauroyltransferase